MSTGGDAMSAGAPGPGSPTGGQVNALLRLRASPPAVPPGFVERPRLSDRLTEAADHPVTLVSAGPGYGKTLTVAAWSRSGAPARPGRVVVGG
jgi:LuxR family transcriptional regulator, maltose regulon positive regulatory protein